MFTCAKKLPDRGRWFAGMLILGLLAGGQSFAGGETSATDPLPDSLGFVTNGPAVFRRVRVEVTNSPPASLVGTNPALARLRQQPAARVTVYTNDVFALFLPDSLNHLVWTNLIAHTNGRSTSLWTERTHPVDWPTNPPVVKWNPNSLIRGWRGWTAISPCWQSEGWSGQGPVTALTRRHGYARGHSMGPERFGTNFAGRKIWFVTARNELVTVKVEREAVRIGAADGQERRDYTIFLFDRDLPTGIEPMGVTRPTEVTAKYAFVQGAPSPYFMTEQGGNVSAEIPGFTVPTWKGGDSGSPNMLPLPGELAFTGRRSTTGPTPEMQADMDELCRLQKLDPKRYQMRWVDLSRFPDYGTRPK